CGEEQCNCYCYRGDDSEQRQVNTHRSTAIRPDSDQVKDYTKYNPQRFNQEPVFNQCFLGAGVHAEPKHNFRYKVFNLFQKPTVLPTTNYISTGPGFRIKHNITNLTAAKEADWFFMGSHFFTGVYRIADIRFNRCRQLQTIQCDVEVSSCDGPDFLAFGRCQL